MKITLVRHTNVAVAPGTIYGFTDVDVATSFSTEAQKVAHSLSENKFDAVYSSPLSRCLKLAAFCGYPNPITDERLKELNFGIWEMQNWNTLNDPLLTSWYADWLHIPARGGESFLDQYQRVSNFLQELKKSIYKDACLFIHSGTIRCILIYAGIFKFEDAFKQDIAYGEKIVVEIG